MMYDPMTRKVANLHNYSTEQGFACFRLEFQTSMAAYKEYQRFCSNGIWLLHDSSLTSFDLKANSTKVTANSAFVYIRNLTIDNKKDSSRRMKQLPVWSSFKNAELPIDAEMCIVSMNAYIELTNENQTLVGKLKTNPSSFVTYVSQLSMYLKYTRMVNIPEFPQELKVDYNVSPLYDFIIDPNRFKMLNYSVHDTLAEKFRKLMEEKTPSLVIVQGGPGTGKTSNVVNCLSKYIELTKQKNKVHRIIICAPSNSAADVFFCKLSDRFKELNLDVLIARIGQKDRFTSAARTKANEIENSFFNCLKVSKNQVEATRGKKLTRQLSKEIMLNDAEFVITTLGSSQLQELITIRNKQFDLLIVDECGQAKFVELLLPMHFTKVHRLLLIGDPQQLGPICKSAQLSTYPPNQVSIFVRLWKYLNGKLTLN